MKKSIMMLIFCSIVLNATPSYKTHAMVLGALGVGAGALTWGYGQHKRLPLKSAEKQKKELEDKKEFLLQSIKANCVITDQDSIQKHILNQDCITDNVVSMLLTSAKLAKPNFFTDEKFKSGSFTVGRDGRGIIKEIFYNYALIENDSSLRAFLIYVEVLNVGEMPFKVNSAKKNSYDTALIYKYVEAMTTDKIIELNDKLVAESKAYTEHEKTIKVLTERLNEYSFRAIFLKTYGALAALYGAHCLWSARG